MTFTFNRNSFIFLFKRLLFFSEKPHWVFGYYVLHILSMICVLLQPLAVMGLFNEIQSNALNNPNQLIKYMYIYVFLFVGFNVAHRVGRYFERQVAFFAKRNVGLKYFFAYATNFPSVKEAEPEMHSAEIASRIRSAGEAISAFGESQFLFIEYLLKFFGPLVALVIIDPFLALFSLILSFSTFSIIAFYDRKLVPLFDQENDIYHTYVKDLTEYTHKTQTVFKFEVVNIFVSKLARQFNLGLPVLLRVIFLNQTKWFLVSIGILITEIGVIFAYLLREYGSQEAIQIGVLAAILQYLQQLTGTYVAIASSYYNVIQWKAKFDSAGFLDKYVSLVTESSQSLIPANTETAWKTLDIHEIKTQNTDPNPFNYSNLVIDKGDKVGLIGESGSGKSTLLEILAGLRPATICNVSLDGTALDLKANTIFICTRRDLI